MIKHIGIAWFNEDGKNTPIQDVIAIVSNLGKMGTVSELIVGTPLGGDPDVIDSSYDLSWALTLESADVMQEYRTDPIHVEVGNELYKLCSEIRAYNVEY